MIVTHIVLPALLGGCWGSLAGRWTVQRHVAHYGCVQPWRMIPWLLLVGISAWLAIFVFEGLVSFASSG